MIQKLWGEERNEDEAVYETDGSEDHGQLA